MIWRARLTAARARRRFGDPGPDREEVVRRHAAGNSFCDVGCMWRVNGRIAFLAEAAGATAVTGIDVTPATPEFEAERERRGSEVRFVRGNLHDETTIAQTGVHDVVWCAGVLYHSPYPVTTLRRLRELTGELLLLQTTTVPELPGVDQGMVFLPGISERQRRLYTAWGEEVAKTIGTFEGMTDEFGPWWWGITPSALRGMLRTAGFEVQDEWGDPFGRTVAARAV